MRINSLRKKTPMLLSLALLLAVSAFAQNTGSLSGIVQDPNGGALAGAKVTVSDPNKGFQLETKANSEGTFSFSTVPPGTYTVTVEANGFKKTVKSGIILNIADRQSTGVIALEVGGIENTVEVTADAAQLLVKTESGEISQTINGEQGRNHLDLVKLTPGVVSFVNAQTAGPGGLGGFNINGTRANQHNLTIDGTTNVDTGSNGTQHIALALDNIAEFKILSSAYQAEYGRSAGGDIKVLTKSGTSQFHGTGYYFHRHEQFNANSYYNNADNLQRNFYRYNYQGYNIGGPVWLPKIGSKYLKERLFFFFSQEWQEQLLPSSARQSRVPTAAEVAGDFSNTRDGNGNLITIINPKTKSQFMGCDGKTANVICSDPSNPNFVPFSKNGQSILSYFNKFANTPLGGPQNGFRFNHQSQFSAGYPRKEYNLRFDYNLSENTRMYVRYTRDADQQLLPYGLGWTGGNNQVPIDVLDFKQAPAFNGTYNLTTTLSPTLTNEFVFGGSQNNLTLDPTNADAATYKGFGFTWQTPFPYPAKQFINIGFGAGSGITNQNFAGTNGYSQFPYKNSNTTFDFYDNVSKVFGTHSAKAGIYINRSRKDQAAGNSMSINFGNTSANSANTGHPYANALLGNFDNLNQPTTGIYQGQYRSTNVEWYLQDNWKVNRKLTLDYGLRFNLIQPQFDQRLQGGFYDPSKYDPTKAVRLFRPVCLTFNASGSCTNRRAIDPILLTQGVTPTVDNTFESIVIGRVVPSSGDPFNGMLRPDVNIDRGGFQNRGIQYGPALGFAYDLFGDQKTVIRGGYRIGYDRVSGNNVIFPSVEQPPTFVNPRFDFGALETVATGGNSNLPRDPKTGLPALGTLGTIRGADFGGHVPNVQSFSLQVQHDLGFDTVLSVGYVGTLSRHLPEDINLNAIPYGFLFTKAAQDPSRFAGGVPNADSSIAQVYKDAGLNFDGSKALPADFLRRYPGYNTIDFKTFGGSSNYHSLQATVQRRFRQGLSLGAAYTWSKALGTASDVEGNFINIICSRCVDYRVRSFDRTHNLVINYLWDLPKLKTNNFLVKGVVNNWQVTGITTFQSGVPTELGFGIPNTDSNQRITGSWTEGPRPVLTGNAQPNVTGGSTQGGSSLDITQLSIPNINPGPQARTLIRRPGNNVTDLAFFKSFPLGGDGQRYIQLRLEMFNAFNHAQFDNINTGLTFNICSDFKTPLEAGDPTRTCGGYRQLQQGSPQSIRNTRTGVSPATGRLGRAVGEFSGQPDYVSNNRRIQLALKIYF